MALFTRVKWYSWDLEILYARPLDKHFKVIFYKVYLDEQSVKIVLPRRVERQQCPTNFFLFFSRRIPNAWWKFFWPLKRVPSTMPLVNSTRAEIRAPLNALGLAPNPPLPLESNLRKGFNFRLYASEKKYLRHFAQIWLNQKPNHIHFCKKYRALRNSVDAS